MLLVNTKKDLEAIKGTPEYDKFIKFLLNGSKKKINKAVYPEKYDNNLAPSVEGYVAPDWQEEDDFTVFHNLGFTQDEILELLKQKDLF